MRIFSHFFYRLKSRLRKSFNFLDVWGRRDLISVFDALLQLLPSPPSYFSILISQTKPAQIGLMEITSAFSERKPRKEQWLKWNGSKLKDISKNWNMGKQHQHPQHDHNPPPPPPPFHLLLFTLIICRCKLTAWDGLYHDFWERYCYAFHIFISIH